MFIQHIKQLKYNNTHTYKGRCVKLMSFKPSVIQSTFYKLLRNHLFKGALNPFCDVINFIL